MEAQSQATKNNSDRPSPVIEQPAPFPDPLPEVVALLHLDDPLFFLDFYPALFPLNSDDHSVSDDGVDDGGKLSRSQSCQIP